MPDPTPEVTARRKALLYRQKEVNYTPMSPVPGESQCAGCRFFVPSGSWTGGMEPASGCSCAIVEGYPLAILPTGLCDKYDALPEDANEPEPMAVYIVEDTEQRGYIAPEPVKANPLKRLFGGKDPSGVTIFRAENGLRRAVHITSNGYKDREAEHVATKALEEYVASQFKGDVWHGDNILDFFHVIDIGDIVAAVVVDGFLVEVSQERSDSPIAKGLWDYWQQTAADGSVVWGTSHEFKAMRDGDTFVRIKKKKTSVLTIDAAANLFTYSEVIPMSVDYEKHLDKALGIDGAAKILRDKGINALNDELRKRGEVAKGVDKPDAPATTPAGSVVDYTPLLTEVLTGIAEHQKWMDARDEQEATRQKSADTQASELKTLTASVTGLTKKLDDFLADTPRKASEDPATKLSGEQEEKARKDIEARTTEYDPAFPGMNVPLQKNGAN